MNNCSEIVIGVVGGGIPLYMVDELANTQGTGKRKELEKSSNLHKRGTVKTGSYK